MTRARRDRVRAARAGARSRPAAQTVAIVGATVIDGTGAEPVKDAVLVIDGGKIAAVGPRASVAIPPGARQIDAAGKYVIPGLMDANVHLVLGSSIEFIVRYEGRYEDLIEEAAQVTLKNGVTTVFDSWGPLQPLLNVRDRIRRGETSAAACSSPATSSASSGPFGRDFNRAAETTASQGAGQAHQRDLGRERRPAADVHDARSGARRDSQVPWARHRLPEVRGQRPRADEHARSSRRSRSGRSSTKCTRPA